MRADWMDSGARTSGSTARPGDATRRASGGAATTNIRAEPCVGTAIGEGVPAMTTSEPTPQHALLGVCGVIFAASVAATIAAAVSMSAMGDMPMPGGWTLSAAWMPMCGQSWPGAAASFLGMWVVMM